MLGGALWGMASAPKMNERSHVISSERSACPEPFLRRDKLCRRKSRNLAPVSVRFLDSTPLPFGYAQGRQLSSPSTPFGAGCSE